MSHRLPYLIGATALAAGVLLGVNAQAGAQQMAAGSHSSVAPRTTGWKVSENFLSTSTPAVISCSSTTDCEVGDSFGGSPLMGTTNGGKVWKAQTAPYTTVTALACSSALDCQAISNGDPMGTTDGGITWTAEAPPESDAAIYTGLACPTTAYCEAVGVTSDGSAGAIMATDDGGTTWTTQSVPLKDIPEAVACGGPTSCEAVGYISPSSSNLAAFIGTTDSGVTWTTQATPGGVGPLDAISCPGPANCVAVGTLGDNVRTSDGGTQWTPGASFGRALYGVSCTTITTCEAGGVDLLLSTTSGGISWTNQSIPAGLNEVVGLSCASTSKCEGIGPYGSDGAAIGTTNGGNAWDTQFLPGENQLDSSACPSATVCLAAGDDLLRTADSGKAWTTKAHETQLGAIDCWTATDCAAAGGGLSFSTDAGKTWTDPQPAPDGGSFAAVQCVSTTKCEAVGSVNGSDPLIARTSNAGASWTIQTPSIASGYLIQSLACPSATNCQAVGMTDTDSSSILIRTTDSGTKWTMKKVPTSVALLSSVTCVSTSACFAAGASVSDSGLVLGTTNGGSAWKVLALPGGSAYLLDIACSSTTVCDAVGSGEDNDGAAVGTTDGGVTWATQPVPTSVLQLFGVAAEGSDFIAVGQNQGLGGEIVRYTP